MLQEYPEDAARTAHGGYASLVQGRDQGFEQGWVAVASEVFVDETWYASRFFC